MKRTIRKHRRGAAAVELAVTMILLVPLIMYTLFLEDLLAYKLEEQEPTLAAGWDYAFVNFQTNKEIGRVPNMNQLKYCDHSSAFDSYQKNYDCNDTVHHEAGTAHQCWLVPGAKQLACGISSQVGMEIMPMNTEFSSWYGAFNKGGEARCTATLAVMNYFLPNKLFNWIGGPRNNITEKKKLGGDSAKSGSGAETVHNEAGGNAEADADDGTSIEPRAGEGGSAGSWILKEEVFAVLTDPWALNTDDDGEADLPETSPDGFQWGHPFWERASIYFGNQAGAGPGFMNQGNSTAKDYREGIDELVGQWAEVDLAGDDPSSLPLAWKPDRTREFNDGYASGWEDQRMSQANRANEFPRAWGP
ncbi:MAG: hypothetical protein AB1938_14255 [Myxococcota bacterium]